MKSEIALDKIIKFYEDDDIEYLFDGELDIIKKDLELLDLLKRNIRYNALLATKCDKQGNISGKYRQLTIIINEEDLDKVKEWLENEHY